MENDIYYDLKKCSFLFRASYLFEHRNCFVLPSFEDFSKKHAFTVGLSKPLKQVSEFCALSPPWLCAQLFCPFLDGSDSLYWLGLSHSFLIAATGFSNTAIECQEECVILYYFYVPSPPLFSFWSMQLGCVFGGKRLVSFAAEQSQIIVIKSESCKAIHNDHHWAFHAGGPLRDQNQNIERN